MQQFKIIFVGAMGAGKTNAIHSVSDIIPVSTEVPNLDTSAHAKMLTTVGIDYGMIRLDSETELLIYGTPGQERFKFIWPVVQQGALGTILFVDNSSPDPLTDMAFYVDYYHKLDPYIRMIVAVTHVDLPGGPSQDQYYDVLAQRKLTWPVFFMDARKKDDVMLLLDTLLAMVEADLD